MNFIIDYIYTQFSINISRKQIVLVIIMITLLVLLLIVIVSGGDVAQQKPINPYDDPLQNV